jgi:protein-S-isoprenylcysteine O-methyltransferase Ste14
MAPSIYHSIYALSVLAFIVIRMSYARRALRAGGPAENKESAANQLTRLAAGITFMAVQWIYIAAPSTFAWASLTLPEWARWAGVVLTAASLGLIIWVQHSLGLNFSTTLHLRQEHTLVTHGPYRWVRHPMYTVLVTLMFSYMLLTANWFVNGLPILGLLAVILSRVAHEEAVMLERFGESYRRYMQHTGRFLPKI